MLRAHVGGFKAVLNTWKTMPGRRQERKWDHTSGEQTAGRHFLVFTLHPYCGPEGGRQESPRVTSFTPGTTHFRAPWRPRQGTVTWALCECSAWSGCLRLSIRNILLSVKCLKLKWNMKRSFS